MEFENLSRLLAILAKSLKQNDFGEDKQKVQYFCGELEKIKNNLPTIDKLEERQKIEVDLETKYEDFYEIANYFDPLYVSIKNKIHTEEVKKIREENRRKRDIKIVF